MYYLSDVCNFVGRRRSNAQNASCPNAVLRESNGDLTSPGIVTAGAEISSDSPFESRNCVKITILCVGIIKFMVHISFIQFILSFYKNLSSLIPFLWKEVESHIFYIHGCFRPHRRF